MNEAICLVIGFFGGGLSSILVFNGLRQYVDKQIKDIKTQIFSFRVELNKWND